MLTGQRLGIGKVDHSIGIVSFLSDVLGIIDFRQKTLETLDNPFGPKLSPMSLARSLAISQVRASRRVADGVFDASARLCRLADGLSAHENLARYDGLDVAVAIIERRLGA